MGDDDGGSALCQLVKGSLDACFRHCIQRRGRLIQNEHRRVLQEDAGDGDALLLPARKEDAPLPGIGCKTFRHSHDILVDLRLFRRLDDFLVCGARSAVPYVLSDCIREQEHILLHDADVLSEGVPVDLADIHAADPNRSGVDIVKPRNQLAKGGFASAGRSDDGDSLPFSNMQADAPDDFHLAAAVSAPVISPVIAFVGEPHLIDVDVVACDRFACAGRHVLFRLQAHDLDEPAQARPAVHEGLHEAGQLADRRDECRDIQIEGDQIRIVHLVPHDDPAADGQDDHRHDAHEELQRRGEHAEGFVVLALGGLEGFIGYCELRVVCIFVCKGFAGADARKAGLHFTVDLRQFLLDPSGRADHPPPVQHDDDQGDRQQNQDHQRQLPLDGKHDDDRADDGDAGDEQILRTMVGHLGDFKQIARHPRQQLARLVPVEKREVQTLHMGEQVVPEVRLDPHAEHVPPVGDDVVHDRLYEEGNGHDDHHVEESLKFLVRQHVVHSVPRHQREYQIYGRRDERAGQIQHKKPHVRLEIIQKYAHGRPVEVFCLSAALIHALILTHQTLNIHSVSLCAPLKKVIIMVSFCESER